MVDEISNKCSVNPVIPEEELKYSYGYWNVSVTKISCYQVFD